MVALRGSSFTNSISKLSACKRWPSARSAIALVKARLELASRGARAAPQQRLNFLPLPQGHAAFRPGSALSIVCTIYCVRLERIVAPAIDEKKLPHTGEFETS